MLFDASDPDARAGGADARHHVLAEPPTGFAFLTPDESEHAQCVLEVRAFVRGDRIGLDRLVRVLPNIFEAFPTCRPHDVLVDCGLFPRVVDPEAKFPTFYFRPEKDGPPMIQPGWAELRSPRSGLGTPRKTRVMTADELVEAYESTASSWSLRSCSNS
jgi:hypothetical protein